MTSHILDCEATSAGGVAQSTSKWLSPGTFALSVVLAAGTASNDQPLQKWGQQQIRQFQTSALSSATPSEPSRSTAAAVSELRRFSGLTWEQLAQVLGVSRRSLHFWASGQSLNASNEDHLRRTLMALTQADRGTARANRQMLMEDHGGILPLDLLTGHNYAEFLRRVGQGAGRTKLHLQPLSQAALDARKPLPPEQLIDALQDPIHRDVGRGRAAHTKRKPRRERG